MSEFRNMLDEFKPEPNCEGSFECHTCSVDVEFAFYDHNKQTLQYVCPEGHKTLLEKFKLF